jgi:alpha-mannosidase
MKSVRFLLAAALAPALVFAQSHTAAPPEPGLSAASLAKLETIASLDELSEGKWHVHPGDLAHGESADDAEWPLVGKGYAGPKEAVWFRQKVTVPKTLHGYDITGERVWFQFHASANGPMPQIIYFNGRRVALGDDLEPIVLFEPARPGETVDIAVKLLATVDNKSIEGATFRVETASGSKRPDPADLRTQAIAAARLLPALGHSELLPTVEKAVSAIDTKALATANQALFDQSLKRSQTILDTLHPILTEAKIVLTGNSHIDAAWLWPATETVDVVKRTFTTALQLMNEYPDYTFTQSAAQYTAWMTDKYPSLAEQIKARVKEGRWEIVGGMWVEPDLNLPDGESQVRQLLVGNRYFYEQYGKMARIGWNPDSFGYNWQLPQIYKRSGLDYFVTQKMHWNDTNVLPFRLFWWESPDGSKVLTYFPTDYVHDNVSPSRIAADFAQSAERNPGTREMMDLYGIGDHGGGPTRAMLDQADHWIAADSTDAAPDMHYGTAQHYFSDVETKLAPDSPTWDYDRIATGYTAPAAGAGTMGVPTWKDELYFEYHRGIYTTQAAHKRNMRMSEVATLDAEKLASLAWLDGAAYPDAPLTEAWKKISFNSFHDLAAGSGIGIIYKDAQIDFDAVFHTDRDISDASLDALAAEVDTRAKGDTPVLVFNPLAWPRSETLTLDVQLPDAAQGIELFDAKDHRLDTQVVSEDEATHTFHVLARVDNVPALGYAVLHALPAKTDASGREDTIRNSEDADAITLANKNVSLIIDRKSGCITSLKHAGTEFLAAGACGNELQAFKDTPKEYDAWNIDPGTLDHPMPIHDVDSVELVDKGPLRSTVRITRHWQNSKFTQDISLDAGADYAVASNTVEWHETHILLKAAFALAASGPKATYEIPYGSIERTTERNNTWQQAQFEVPAMRWADLGNAQQGFSILNDSKYGYDAAGNTLRLTLLRSPTWPDPDADRGTQHFRYALYPHTGSWKDAETMHRGYEFNYLLSAMQIAAHSGTLPAEHSFASVENPNVTLTAMKKAEDANALIFRMVEWAGKESTVKLHTPPGATAATETNLMEKPEGGALTVEKDTVTATIHPYEILTLEVSYPHK